MDKFTVDLEKVLDEFEYNEGREEGIVSAATKNHASNPVSHHQQVQRSVRPPAANYRRPAFEPINLADADFSAAPITTASNYNSVFKQNNNNYSRDEVINHNGNYSPVILPEQFSKEVFEPTKESPEVSPSEGLNGPKEENAYNECTVDGKPDLLHGETGRNMQSSKELSTRLPDITSSAHSAPESLVSDNSHIEFDLIKPGISSCDDLPPVVDVGSIVEEELPLLCVHPVTFDSVDNASDSELREYLEALEGVNTAASAPPESLIDSDQVEAEPEIVPESPRVIPQDIAPQETENFESETTKDSSLVMQPEGFDDLKEDISEITEDSSGETINSDLSNLVTEDSSLMNEGTDRLIEESDCSNVEVSDVGVVDVGCDDKPEEQTMTEAIVDASGLDNTVEAVEHEEVEEEKELLEEEQAVEIGQLEVSGVADLDTETEEIENNVNEERAERQKVVEGEEAEEGDVSYGDPAEPQESRPARPTTLTLNSSPVTDSEESPTPSNSTSDMNVLSPEERNLGKLPPYWVPDTQTDTCLQCDVKFTMIKRRHHCRACGLVLCSKCCSLKAPLEYMEFAEARVCQPCFNIIFRRLEDNSYNNDSGRHPNPNNPMEYCSTIPPMQQAAGALLQPPPSVLVPTGVLKREGRAKSDVPKQVMFSDGIRPGGDLTELDGSSESRIVPRKPFSRRMVGGSKSVQLVRRSMDPKTQSLIPSEPGRLPPTVSFYAGQISFSDDTPVFEDQPHKFAINYNLFVSVKRVKLDCCVNRVCWSACSEGLSSVGQDEIALILECLPDEELPPVDIFLLVNALYFEASKGTTVTEMSFTPSFVSFVPTLFGSKDHGGFLYIRSSFQCTTNLLLPPQPYLVALLVHRWETPWARLFPLRLVLRLGAEYRYYPCPLVSIRNRPPLYTDIGHTIMKILVDFRKYSYSLATVRGLLIHVEDRQTTILFPRNRYDQVLRALNNSNDSVLAFGANLSLTADSHLVCIQSSEDENSYTTQAINIHNKPRRVTGASFVVFNGALKTAGLSGKSKIVEDGLMVHISSTQMTKLRTALREMHDFSISCGPNDEETVLLHWTKDDTNFNIGVKSNVDLRPLDGVPSIRVHNGTDYPCHSRIIRWTEVFILQCEEGSRASDSLDISKVSESLSRATCTALVPVLDLLAEAGLFTIAIRATIHPDNVGYEAGSNGDKLPGNYMKLLDDHLIPVLHQVAMSSQDTPAILELIFKVMNHP